MKYSRYGFLGLIAVAALAICTPIVSAVTTGFMLLTGFLRPAFDFRIDNGHPRSVLETRRMGLL